MVSSLFFKKSVDYIRLAQIPEIIGFSCKFPSEFNEKAIYEVSNLQSGGAGCVSFFQNRKYAAMLEKTACEFCFVAENDLKYVPKNTIALVCGEPYLAMAKISAYFYEASTTPKISINYGDFTSNSGRISKSAKIDKSAIIGENAQIGDGVVIEAGVKIGKNAIISHNSVIGANCKIGDNCTIFENCTIKYSIIGDNCTFKNGAKIGQDGFGFAPDKIAGSLFKIVQLGVVKIGNSVEIGANSCVDRGSLDDTVISDGVKIDNLVQIGHNVKIGAMTVIAGCTGIAGSANIGSGCMIGGQVGVVGHITIGNGVKIAARSMVESSIKDGKTIAGSPATNMQEWLQSVAVIRKIVKMRRKFFKDNFLTPERIPN